MNGIKILKQLIESKISKIAEEIKFIELLILKINISKTLANNYRNITLCKDEDIRRLIEAHLINISFEEYKSIKEIISNEELFRIENTGFIIPQYEKALQQAEIFLNEINKHIEDQREKISSYQDRIKHLTNSLKRCQKIIKDIDSNNPILDIDFILNLVASSSKDYRINTTIISDLITFNTRIFTQEKESPLSYQPLQPEEIYSSEELEDKELEEDDILDREEEIIKTSINIINQNNYPSLIGYINQLQYYLSDIKACNQLLEQLPNDINLKDKRTTLEYLEKTIDEYQSQLRNLIKEETIEIDKTALLPGEQYRLIYFMHPKKLDNLTPDDFFSEDLISFFEEDFMSIDNVDNYKLISKLLSELRNGILRKKGEHDLFDVLKGYFLKAEKGGQKPRMCVRKINEDTILIFGYAKKDDNAKSSKKSYTSSWENRERVYGNIIDEIIKRINEDPFFRQKAYYIGRTIDDRVIDTLETRRTKTLR